MNIERAVKKIPVILTISNSEVFGEKYLIIVKYKKKELEGYDDCEVLNQGETLLKYPSSMKDLIIAK